MAAWRWPSLTVSAIQAGERGRTGNVVMDSGWARIGLRIVPDMDAEVCAAALEAHLRARVPAGMELVIRRQSASSAWGSPTDHPLFATALGALEHGYGVKPVFIGCGGSIPFVGEMTGKLGGIPALLTGVEDPGCALLIDPKRKRHVLFMPRIDNNHRVWLGHVPDADEAREVYGFSRVMYMDQLPAALKQARAGYAKLYADDAAFKRAKPAVGLPNKSVALRDALDELREVESELASALKRKAKFRFEIND